MERLTFNVGALAQRTARTSSRAASHDGAGRHPPRQRRGGSSRRVRERYDWDYLWMLALHGAAVLPAAGSDSRPRRAAPVGADRDRRPCRDGRPPHVGRADRSRKINAEVIGVVALGGDHRADAAVLDLAGRLAAGVHRHLRQDHPDLRADGQHDHLAEARAADDVDHDRRVRLHRRRAPCSTTCAASTWSKATASAARSAACSKTRTTWR